MPTTQQTHYEVLGVARDATLDDIKKHYRKLARALHPDVLASQNLSAADLAAKQERFKQVTHAYDVLSDSEQRKRYDLGIQFGGGGFRFTPGPTAGPQMNDAMREAQARAQRQFFEDLARKLAEDLANNEAYREAQESTRRHAEALKKLRANLQLRLATVQLMVVVNYLALVVFLVTVFITQLVTKHVEQIQAGFSSLVGLSGGFDWALVSWAILGIAIGTFATAGYMFAVWMKTFQAVLSFKEDAKAFFGTFKHYLRSAIILAGTVGFILAALQHF